MWCSLIEFEGTVGPWWRYVLHWAPVYFHLCLLLLLLLFFKNIFQTVITWNRSWNTKPIGWSSWNASNQPEYEQNMSQLITYIYIYIYISMSNRVNKVLIRLNPDFVAASSQLSSDHLNRDEKKNKFVYLMVNFGGLHSEERLLMVSFHSGYIFIQTDKPIYNPGDTGETWRCMSNTKLCKGSDLWFLTFIDFVNVSVWRSQGRKVVIVCVRTFSQNLSKTFQHICSRDIWMCEYFSRFFFR